MDQLIRQNRPGLSRLVVLLIAAALLALSAVGLTVTTTGGPGGAAVVGVASADPAEAPAAPADDDKPGLGERLGKVWGDFERCRSVGLYGDLCLGKGVVDAGGAVVGAAKDKAVDKVEDAVEGQFQKAIVTLGNSSLRFVMWMLSFWVDKPSNIVLSAGTGVDDRGHTDGNNLLFSVQDYTMWLQGLLGVFSVLAVGVRFTLSRWSEAEDSATDFVRMLGRIVLASAVWVPG
ncbi:hypothetical protein [Corynebacterium bovis]|uniref:Uncharacterized protein n=2 Tax=Corynebacterium bovis TaxID=36808 RepID=A0A3R8VSU2_9CORY|nr:hypothetical protein [Corynebacterium bovis]RRO85727.1 hypothetical protein CXF48_09755 [Corynebacterium bovis]